MLRPFYFVLAALAFLAGAAPSQAQVFIVASCGTVPASQATLTAGNPGMLFIDTTGKLCANVTVSATASIAAFAPVGTNNAIAVTSTTARTALTGAAANSTTLVENSGATDVFVAFGDNTVTVTAANGTRVPAGWAIAFNIGAATNIAYITASSTSTINATTGTGLPALGAAGSGGGGGGAITAASGAFASGALSAGSVAAGAGVDGWDLTQGAKADAACGTDNGTCSIAALAKRIAQNLSTLNTTAAASIATGPNLIGNTGLVLPAGSTPIQATATGTTAATTATMAADATQFNFICGYSIRANATAAATGNATVTGLATSPLNFTQWTAPNASGLGVTEQIFVPCQPSSAINTAIAVVSAAPGTGGVVSVSVWGFKKVASP